jgi:hypothetical protein
MKDQMWLTHHHTWRKRQIGFDVSSSRFCMYVSEMDGSQNNKMGKTKEDLSKDIHDVSNKDAE